LERFPITWNYAIEREALRLKELEHVKTKKVEELFGFRPALAGILKARSLVMKVRVSHLLSGLSVAAILAFTPLAASAQNAPMMGGGMKGEEMMKGCDMMGGDMAHMSQMMTMMREKLSHAGDRIASLKTELKITEAQTPAWNKFSDALIASAKSMEEEPAPL
jgi:hypothetical protein